MFTAQWGQSAQAVIQGIGVGIAAIIALVLVISIIVALYSDRHHEQAMTVFTRTLMAGFLIAGASWIVGLIPGLH